MVRHPGVHSIATVAVSGTENPTALNLTSVCSRSCTVAQRPSRSGGYRLGSAADRSALPVESAGARLLTGDATRMIRRSTLQHRNASLWAIAGGLLIFIGAACNGDGIAPTAQAAPPVDSTTGTPVDTTVTPSGDTAVTAPGDSTPDTTATPPGDSTSGGTNAPTQEASSSLPGIAFGSFDMEQQYFSSVHTGTVRGGGLSPTNILSLLSDARAKGARVVVKLCMGRDSFVKNSDGSFSLTKWKALVDRYKSVNLAPYIADGTLVGHFLIDEPSRASKWGGKIIPQSTVEAMATYSKQLWPGMTTMVRVVPSWLKGTPISYTSLDAAWAQYATSKGNLGQWIGAEVAAAKTLGLGLAVGLNVLDGGNGSSGIPGWTKGRHAMSANELRSYGTTLLNQSYSCGFFMWMYDGKYYGRSDMKSAMADLSAKARSHARTSCKQ
jgi:hypothetical protein